MYYDSFIHVYLPLENSYPKNKYSLVLNVDYWVKLVYSCDFYLLIPFKFELPYGYV